MNTKIKFPNIQKVLAKTIPTDKVNVDNTWIEQLKEEAKYFEEYEEIVEKDYDEVRYTKIFDAPSKKIIIHHYKGEILKRRRLKEDAPDYIKNKYRLFYFSPITNINKK